MQASTPATPRGPDARLVASEAEELLGGCNIMMVVAVTRFVSRAALIRLLSLAAEPNANMVNAIVALQSLGIFA